jgi:hypothetical protein
MSNKEDSATPSEVEVVAEELAEVEAASEEIVEVVAASDFKEEDVVEAGAEAEPPGDAMTTSQEKTKRTGKKQETSMVTHLPVLDAELKDILDEYAELLPT